MLPVPLMCALVLKKLPFFPFNSDAVPVTSAPTKEMKQNVGSNKEEEGMCFNNRWGVVKCVVWDRDDKDRKRLAWGGGGK